MPLAVLTSVPGLLWWICAAPALLSEGQPPVSRGHPSPPVLSFPEPGLDDSAAYQGYQTRFFRDAAGNTVQVYLDGRSGRVVNLWADADDESLGLTVHNSGNRPTVITWGNPDATVAIRGRRGRTFEYQLVAHDSAVELGHFLLGSMRVERDFQYAGAHEQPLTAPPFVPPEMTRLLTALERLPAAERRRQLRWVNAAGVNELRSRLTPTITTYRDGADWVARVVQPSLDARDTLVLEVRVPAQRVQGALDGDVVRLAARSGAAVPFTLRLTTTARALTPLARKEIFTPDFLRFLAGQWQADSTSPRTRWLEREVRGVELLSSREKLMAGLPAYATYFGRDMLVSALMMRPIWRPEMSEFVVDAVLRKLGPHGEVSHEEALGGQADREAANEYAALIDDGLRARAAGERRAADSLLARAGDVLRAHRRVRENYHMIDNAYQLPVLAGLWLSDPQVPVRRKRAFLRARVDGEANARRLLRQLSYVARTTAAYVDNPLVTNLVSFPKRDSTHWQSASWRDSNEGYAGGRFAMDVNAIWVPHALDDTRLILAAMRAAGISADSVLSGMPAEFRQSPLAQYAADPSALPRALERWHDAATHFLVTRSPDDVRADVAARLAALPEAERRYWEGVIAATHAEADPVSFLALSLDADGKPIAVANTDPATRLFLLRDTTTAAYAGVLRDVSLFVRPYPVGLFIDRVGPVVANDAYAPPAVWPQFEKDRYHGPRVVWGREVNLFLLGVMNQMATARDPAYRATLRAAVDSVQKAAEASGFHSELWSYELRGGRMEPLRYNTGSDVQLWSTTDLAVQYGLWRMRQ